MVLQITCALLYHYFRLVQLFWLLLLSNFLIVLIHQLLINFTANNVYCLPSFKFNMLFASQQFKTRKRSVMFSHDSCIFQEMPSKKTVGLGRQREGLH